MVNNEQNLWIIPDIIFVVLTELLKVVIIYQSGKIFR